MEEVIFPHPPLVSIGAGLGKSLGHTTLDHWLGKVLVIKVRGSFGDSGGKLGLSLVGTPILFSPIRIICVYSICCPQLSSATNTRFMAVLGRYVVVSWVSL